MRKVDVRAGLFVVGLGAVAACTGDGGGGGTPRVDVQGIRATPRVQVVPPGGSAGETIVLLRGTSDAAVSVEVTGLPAGVTADPLTIAEGTTAGTLVLHASASAAPGASSTVVVTADVAQEPPPSWTFTVVVAGAPGVPDPSKGDGGVTLFAPPAPYERGRLRAIAATPDGGIAAAGELDYPTGSNVKSWLVVKTDAAGDPDPAFNGGAPLVLEIANDYGAAGVAALADGSLVVVGTVTTDGGIATQVVKLRPDGTFDPTFGSGGMRRVYLGTSSCDALLASGLAIQADGKILLAGRGVECYQAQAQIVRLLADGSVDTTFALDGSAGVPLPGANYLGHALAVAVRPNGKILASGFSLPTESGFVAQLTTAGQIDTTFGSNGFVVSAVSGSRMQWNSLALRGDGSTIVAGYSADIATYGVARASEVDATGAPSAAFGASGAVEFTDIEAFWGNVTVDATGRVLVPGKNPLHDADLCGLVRLTTGGALDPAFGEGGYAYLPPVVDGEPWLRAGALVPGSMAVAGHVYYPGDTPAIFWFTP